MEEWKVYPQNPNLVVSTFGNVKTLYQYDSKCTCPTLRDLPQYLCNGYCVVMCAGKSYQVHRLVAETFIEKPENRALVAKHIDGNKFNNNVNNIRWITYQEQYKLRQNSNQAAQPRLYARRKPKDVWEKIFLTVTRRRKPKKSE